MVIRGVFFDFGYVIGYPTPGIDRKYFYLDWDGIPDLLQDRELAGRWQPGIDRAALEVFFEREIYQVYRQHEETDSIDPGSNTLLLKKLHQVLAGPIDQPLIDQLLGHLDTMKYIMIDTAAIEVVGKLKRRGYRLALVSNMMLPGRLLEAKLGEAQIREYWDAVVISSDVGYIKPHPEIFHRALALCQLRADEVVFVGDTYQQDILGAKRAGLKTVWLNSRNEPQEQAASDPPDLEIETLSELIEKLDFELLR